MLNKDKLIELGVIDEVADNIMKEVNGEYIPKYRYDEVNEDKKKLEESLADRNEQLEALKESAKETDGLKEEIEKLQTANQEAENKYKAEMLSIKRENAIAESLRTAGVTNSKAIRGLLNDEAITFDDKGIQGLEAQIEELKKDETLKSLFEAPKKPTGKKPVEGSGDNTAPTGIMAELGSILGDGKTKEENNFDLWGANK